MSFLKRKLVWIPLAALSLLFSAALVLLGACGETSPPTDVRLLKMDANGPTLWVAIDHKVSESELRILAQTIRYQWKEGSGRFAVDRSPPAWGTLAQRQLRLRLSTMYVFFYLPGMHPDRTDAGARVSLAPDYGPEKVEIL